MRRKPIVFLSALALATLGLTACGAGADDNGEEATSPAAASEEETGEGSEQQEETTEETLSDDEETSPEADGDGDEADADGDEEGEAPEAGTADPGPAPEGAVIPAGAVTEPPQEIGEYALMDGSGPAHIYSHADSSTMISLDSNVLGSPYETLVGEIETDNVPAGTGSCGTNESGSSITCYQRTEDGVITLTAVPEEISVEEMAVFVNQYAEAAGAA